MTKRNTLRNATLVLVCATLTGCMPKMTIEEMKAAMPQRPAELDHLNAFVGQWESETEVTMAGIEDVIKSQGTSDIQWHGDKWFLVGHSSFNMGDCGEATGIETWMYDVKSKKFRTTWTDSMGSISMGTARYDEKTKTWHMRAKGYDPDGTTTGKGHIKMLDDNTMEWTWTEYTMGGLMETMKMTGTMRRK